MYRNAEHYYCPTEGLAIAHVMEEMRKKKHCLPVQNNKSVVKKQKKETECKSAGYRLVWTDTQPSKKQYQHGKEEKSHGYRMEQAG